MPGGKLSVASNWKRCDAFSSVGAFTDMTDTLFGHMADPELWTIGLVLEEGILVQKNLLLYVMYCWPFIFQLQPII